MTTCLVKPCPKCEPEAARAAVASGPIKSVPGVSVRRDGNLLQGGMVPGRVRMGASDADSKSAPASSAVAADPACGGSGTTCDRVSGGDGTSHGAVGSTETSTDSAQRNRDRFDSDPLHPAIPTQSEDAERLAHETGHRVDVSGPSDRHVYADPQWGDVRPGARS